jgi:outer membrane protein assembly factor BamB
MRLDELGRDAGHRLLMEAQETPRPSIGDVGRRRERRSAVGTGLAIIIGVAALGIVILLLEREDSPLARIPGTWSTATQEAQPKANQLPYSPLEIWSLEGVGMVDAFAPDAGRLLALGSDAVYVADGYGGIDRVLESVIAISVEGGEMNWKREFEQRVFIQGLTPDVLLVNAFVSSTQSDEIHGLSPIDGATRWTISLPDGFTASGGSISDGILYLAAHATTESDTRAPIIYALDPASGSVRWTAELAEGTDLQPAPPVAGNGVLVVSATLSHPGSAEGNVVHAVDLATGGIRWTSDLGGDQYFTVHKSLIATGVAAIDQLDRTVALNLADGSFVWEMSDGHPLGYAPSGNLLLAAAGGLVEVEPATGTTLRTVSVDWEPSAELKPRSAVALGDCLVVSSVRKVAGYSSDGALLWSLSASGTIVDFPVVMEEALVVAIGDHTAAPPEDRRVVFFGMPVTDCS